MQNRLARHISERTHRQTIPLVLHSTVLSASLIQNCKFKPFVSALHLETQIRFYGHLHVTVPWRLPKCCDCLCYLRTVINIDLVRPAKTSVPDHWALNSFHFIVLPFCENIYIFLPVICTSLI